MARRNRNNKLRVVARKLLSLEREAESSFSIEQIGEGNQELAQSLTDTPQLTEFVFLYSVDGKATGATEDGETVGDVLQNHESCIVVQGDGDSYNVRIITSD